MKGKHRLPAMVVATIVSLGALLGLGQPALAACYLPGDHTIQHTSTLKSSWDWNGWTSCITIGNPNSGSRTYRVQWFARDSGGTWRLMFTETRTLRCTWWD
jgi:hypothetical protein